VVEKEAGVEEGLHEDFELCAGVVARRPGSRVNIIAARTKVERFLQIEDQNV
jgi:hypothetical protein